jgi:hypothetical protein
MYTSVAEASGKRIPDPEPAETPSYSEVAKAVNGTIKQGLNEEQIGDSVGRLVKRTGVDTTMKNAIRDGAEWAWIPHGDTCAFCLMLGSNGWQKASKKALAGGHAKHIHANCDCTYAIRFDKNTEYAGYDPDALYEQYKNAEGKTWKEKLRSMARDVREKHKPEINARKRELYAQQKTKKAQPVVTNTPARVENPTHGCRDVTNDWLKRALPNSHQVSDLPSFTQDGTTYSVHGTAVQFTYTDKEKQIAELLERELGGEIYMMPKVNSPEGISTPDYLFRGNRYDLKEITASGKDTVYNAIHKKREQANNFVIDYTKSGLSHEEIVRQSEAIFSRPYVSFVERIVVVRNGVIEKILERG